MKAKNLYIQTRISEKEKARIDIICERESITASEFMRDALREKVRAYKAEHKQELFAESMAQIVANCDKDDQIDILEKYNAMIEEDND